MHSLLYVNVQNVVQYVNVTQLWKVLLQLLTQFMEPE